MISCRCGQISDRVDRQLAVAVIDDADDLAAIGQDDLILVAVRMLDADDDAEELDLGLAVEIGADCLIADGEENVLCHGGISLLVLVCADFPL